MVPTSLYSGGIAGLLFTLLITASCSQPEVQQTLRVMSFNIAAGHGDLDRIASVISEYDPDIVALQEVDVHWSGRSDYMDQARYLGETLDMDYFFGEIYLLSPHEAGDPERKYGLAFLSKMPISNAQNHHISRLSTQWETDEPEVLPGFPEISVELYDQTIHFYNTHLDYRSDPSVRQTQVYEMLSVMEDDGPVLLLGDLNARPGSTELDPLFEVFSDAWTGQDDPGYTFPADDPDRRIDYILHSPHFEVLEIFVAETEASDHRPVIADLLLKQL